MSVAVRRVERSGPHRVVGFEIGDVRQAMAALAGVATLARATGVGPNAIRDVLPELRAACTSIPSAVSTALIPACDGVALATGLVDEARRVVEVILACARRAAAGVLNAVAAIERKGLGARTRLELQAACDDGLEDLRHVRYSIELLQRASTSEAVSVSLHDVFSELDLACAGGSRIELAILGEIDASVAVHPHTAIAVVLGALAHARALGDCDVTTPSNAYIAIARATDDRLSIEIRRRTNADPSGPTIKVRLPDPAPFDELVLRLAAATLAAPLHLDGGTVNLELLRI